MKRPAIPDIIDIEASGFGAGSYPIEVGVALDDSGKYCALVHPVPDWQHWDPSAERVHGIPRSTLRTHGKTPLDVAGTLNRVLRGRTLYSDAWVVDKPWMTTLYAPSRIPMAFRVSPLELILAKAQMARWHAAKDGVLAEVDRQRHRASIDAWVLQQTYARTFSEPDTVCT